MSQETSDDSNSVVVNVINNLPLSFAAKVQLRNKYQESESIVDLVEMILNKPIQQYFTTGQLKSLNILVALLPVSEQNQYLKKVEKINQKN